MRGRACVGALLVTSLVLGGCSTIRHGIDYDLHYPGGVAGEVIDRHYMVSASNSKELELYRYAMATALFSRAATANIRSGKESDAFIATLQDTIDEINYAQGHLYLSTPSAIQQCEAKANASAVGCLEYRANFESDLPLVEAKLLNLGFAALPKEQAVALYSAARRMDPLATGRAFVALALDSLASFHRAAAVHRTDIELLASLTGGEVDNDTTVLTAYCYLKQHSQTAPKAEGICAGVAVPPGPYRLKPITSDDYAPIAAIIQTSCVILPVNAQASNNDSAVSDRRTACRNLEFTPKHRLAILSPPAPVAAAAPVVSPPVATAAPVPAHTP